MPMPDRAFDFFSKKITGCLQQPVVFFCGNEKQITDTCMHEI
jgi:hypothetical protein